MASLLPADFDLSRMEHSERRVCRSFLDGLDDSWTVIPNVGVCVDNKDYEIDLVLVSATRGVLLVEVKGGAIRLEQGRWVQNGRTLAKTPIEQVTKAQYALVQRLRSCQIDTHGLFMTHAVALPDVGAVPPQGLGPDAPAKVVFAKPDLEFPEAGVSVLLHEHEPVPPEQLRRFLQALRPDLELSGGDGPLMEMTSRRLDDATRAHLASTRSLDKNRRVLVTGGAGTGKTWLVLDWAKQALARDERTLVVCFNKPIAEQMARALEGTPAMVGTYHDVAVHLLEPFGFQIGASPTPEYWRDIPTQALEFHSAKIGTPFDTIVVDEGQDFYPHWVESLEHLLDPAGARKLLMVADPAQAIYVKPWVPPAEMFEAELAFNLRNSRSIATLVQRLGGPAPLPGAPGRMPVRHFGADGRKVIRKRVRDAVLSLTGDHGVPMSQIVVLTTQRSTRDDLVAEPPEGCRLVRWEERCEDAVLCETVHRAKGLERTAVILVDMSGNPDPQLLYIGTSRAVSSLTLIGPPQLAEAVGVIAG